ncbi:1-aminocyclopropane-1-carboxylate deaminase/D-cysteine desulfhydrase [Cellvibrio mixtus]|uniref:1-aminocyclopropane-1-carboxylate deaminase/D-cysteine desulfhydrase n=1 Tax=Cellvibrio mixtus TaxID=39650 RepID=UPI0006932A97|nr:pyridoxal-phosphate dependent enzyme [Cellvibrio mixtus]
MVIDSDSDFYRLACAVPLHIGTTAELANRGIELLVRRDDLIDDGLSGNKAYKLFYNLRAAREAGHTRLLSFGGAYSNHLYALAMAGARYSFSTVGIVRGARPTLLSPTLIDAEQAGMQLVFIGRDEYRQKTLTHLLGDWRRQFGDFYLIPEGGAGLLGARGMSLATQALEAQLKGGYTGVCVACGTGTSLAGLAAGLVAAGRSDKPALGFSVLKGDGDLGTGIAKTYTDLCASRGLGEAESVKSAANWRLISGFHAGGYGKKHPAYLFDFWRSFERETGIPLDPVYTLKMIWGIHCLAQQGYWSRGSRIVAIHSGGLQGRRGFVCP